MDASFFNLERTGQLLHIAGVYTVEGALNFALWRMNPEVPGLVPARV